MARPIWKGTISFGLISIPMELYSAEKANELHFHLLDKRNNARIRYERINEETGKEVPWNNIVKAYEFEKGNYVIVDEKELEKTAYENPESVDLENFIDRDALEPIYFERPYYMVPTKQGEKGYTLLRETLEKSKKIGIAKVVIKTRQHLAAVIPYHNVLLLNLLRFPNEIRSEKEFQVGEGIARGKKGYKITAKEIIMAERLVKSMTAKWNPKKYHDENRKMLSNWIENKIKHGKFKSKPSKPKEQKPAKGAKVIDFMELLKKSVAEKEKSQGGKKKRVTGQGKRSPASHHSGHTRSSHAGHGKKRSAK